MRAFRAARQAVRLGDVREEIEVDQIEADDGIGGWMRRLSREAARRRMFAAMGQAGWGRATGAA
ncbi:hypothetical protein BZL54_09370 [Burkholderia ubonensis subsp. mesacidophila]|uniref:Uncharacterized protein n=1 Tax=Burkholderia ubonensis subsp. mesacidophila TaxID=265293 RepID=A0A2A4FJJ8_9BURK|nr:hypothetical protein BZL54_09370 [Burkholderia ubonensis subsp. mesacidophila]